MKALLGRNRPRSETDLLVFDDLELSLSHYKVRRRGKPIPLGPKEFRLLRQFMQNPEQVFSRDKLVNVVWDSETEIDCRSIDVLVLRLRKAINAGFERHLIRTVRYEGYSLAGGR